MPVSSSRKALARSWWPRVQVRTHTGPCTSHGSSILSGSEAQFPDEDYISAGASVVSPDELYASSDILLKVRPPLLDKGLGAMSELDSLKHGSTLISFLYPAQNQDLIKRLAEKQITSFAMDCVPRESIHVSH